MFVTLLLKKNPEDLNMEENQWGKKLTSTLLQFRTNLVLSHQLAWIDSSTLWLSLHKGKGNVDQGHVGIDPFNTAFNEYFPFSHKLQ